MLEGSKLYRKWKRGKWYYLKAKNTPPMRMFAWWTRNPDCYNGVTILHAEDHGEPKRKIWREGTSDKIK